MKISRSLLLSCIYTYYYYLFKCDLIFINMAKNFVLSDDQFPFIGFLMTTFNPCTQLEFSIEFDFKLKLQTSLNRKKLHPQSLWYIFHTLSFIFSILHTYTTHPLSIHFIVRLNCFVSMHTDFVTSKQVTLLVLHMGIKERRKRKNEEKADRQRDSDKDN